jgi:hypothetical protein
MSGFGMGSICAQERFDASPCDCHNQTDALPKCNSVAFSRDGLCRARRHALSPQQFVWRWQLRESAARLSEGELQFAPAGSFPVHLHFRRLIIQIDVPIFAKCIINKSEHDQRCSGYHQPMRILHAREHFILPGIGRT